MTAIDIHRHFLERAHWVDPETTVDQVSVGDPATEVRRVLVTWIASFQAEHPPQGSCSRLVGTTGD